MRNKLLLSLFTLIIAVFFSSIAGADLLDGLIGYWPLDESSGETASDASGSNNVVTLVGDGATWDPAGGKIGGGASCTVRTLLVKTIHSPYGTTCASWFFLCDIMFHTFSIFLFS